LTEADLHSNWIAGLSVSAKQLRAEETTVRPTVVEAVDYRMRPVMARVIEIARVPLDGCW
jgi:hypothetical protein